MSTVTLDPPNTHRSAWRRANALRWLRRVHGWIGLWGAGLGLLFGVSGVLLNHRAVLKIPAAQTQESTVQMPLSTPVPENARALAQWLRSELKLDRDATRIREEPSRPALWGDKTVTQPAHWMLAFTTPQSSLQADYWVGNATVTLKRGDNNFFATLGNLHKGVGLGIGWVLLVDTLAGSIILLSLTGVVLWTGLNKKRTVGAMISIGSLLATIVLIAQAL
jgi:hypothetical protein